MSFWVAGAAIGGAAISSSAVSSAADQQAGASAASAAQQQAQYDQTRRDQTPYRAVGAGALGQLSELTGVKQFDGAAYLRANPDVAGDPYWASHPEDHYQEHGRNEGRAATYTQTGSGFGSYAQGPTAAEVQMDPGYEFGRQEGQKAIDRKVAASGGRISGASLKAAAQYGTDYATTGYSTAYNRVNQARSDRLNRLAALAGIGQTATQQVGQAGQASANAIGQIATAQGNASGAATVAQSNIWGGAGNQLAALYGRSGTTTTTQPAVYDDGYSIGQGSAYNGSRAGQ